MDGVNRYNVFMNLPNSGINVARLKTVIKES